ncbi:sensor histidine kinase [Bifidobacterium callimiconis]|uniref:histidine kinase n=1 Tax=Bifidobacterium callimiconis TaxID=2306973 RepID=A0A430FIG8_9BIFI|nr:histidine kinase [Bifidobacterium callimiconis]RSX52694.1 two component system histidine kinase [Bifidobacterium callimiconis]
MSTAIAALRRAVTPQFGDIDNRVLIPDALIALTLTALCAVSITYGTLQDGLLFHYTDDAAAVRFWTWIYGLPLMFRRRLPRASALAFVLLCLVQLVFGPALVLSNGFALMHVYAVIVYGERDTIRPFIVMAVGMTLVTAGVNTSVQAFGPLAVSAWQWYTLAPYDCLMVNGMVDISTCGRQMRMNFLWLLVMIAAPLAAVIVMGYWQRARLSTIRMMRERNAALEARQEEETRIAALAERARIARDMHDVVAHTLSIIIVQADGGRFAGANDPKLARSTMETIRHESMRALGDMKRLLGIFGPPADHASVNADESHAPGYADVAGLIRQADSASSDTHVTHTVVGTPEPDELGTLAASTVYRVVQESLTNIRKYAGPGVNVGVEERWSADGLRIRVIDDGRGLAASADGHKPGYGLVGMRERIDSLGGSCSAGPRLGGGFEVDAFIPFHGEPRRVSPDPRQNAMSGIDDASSPAASATMASGSSMGASTSSLPNASDVPVPNAASGFKQMIMDHYRRVVHTVRQLGSMPDSPESSKFNMIERVSQWTERHYLIMDTVYVVLILLLFGSPTSGIWVSNTDGGTLSSAGPGTPIWAWSNISVVLPVIWRRRFPQASAAVFAGLTILQLLFLPWLTVAGLISVYSVYSVTLYGPRTAKRWTIPLIGVGSVLFAAKMTLSAAYEVGTIWRAVMLLAEGGLVDIARPGTIVSGASALLVIAVNAIVTFVTLMGAMAAGMWSRSRGSNMLVLQAREEALREEERKQKVLAANMERDRISANIQTDVTDTLLGVIGKADAGLRALDDGHADAATITAAFEGIATEGRAALKRMRQLLGVLRETGFSDETTRNEGMRLAPAVSLDQQLQLKR